MMRFIKEYFVWHYGEAVREFFAIWENFLWFGYHFFSLPLLARTYGAPIYRLEQKGARTIDIGAILGNFIVTTIMRLVGMLVRTAVIAAGIVFESALIAAGVLAFLLWLALPMLAAILGISGIAFLFA